METIPSATSIVIIGAMNPRIHLPCWYSGADIISNDDLQAAQQTLIVVPRITQFSMDHIRITCQDDRWELFAEEEGSFGRGLEIAVATWSKLPETPVSSYGINFMSSIAAVTHGPDNILSSLLLPDAARLSGSPLGAELKIVGEETGLAQITIDLRPSRQLGNTISIAINYHFSLDESNGYFDLASALETKYSICLESAKAKLLMIERLIECVHSNT